VIGDACPVASHVYVIGIVASVFVTVTVKA